MKTQILFIHGGGDDGYGEDKKLANSLGKELGTDYTIRYPEMAPHESQWLKQIGEELSSIEGELILAGHSLGASMLLKFFSENKIKRKINAIFLVAPPFWSGNEDWVQPLKLEKKFAEKLPKDVPIYVYQCKDDDVVPYDHFMTYKKNIPWAVFREMEEGGHQFNDDLSIVASDIKSL